MRVRTRARPRRAATRPRAGPPPRSGASGRRRGAVLHATLEPLHRDDGPAAARARVPRAVARRRRAAVRHAGVAGDAGPRRLAAPDFMLAARPLALHRTAPLRS